MVTLGHKLGQINEIPFGHFESYNLTSNDQFSNQLDNKLDLIVLPQWTLELCQIHFVGKITQVGDPGPLWPTCLLFP